MHDRPALLAGNQGTMEQRRQPQQQQPQQLQQQQQHASVLTQPSLLRHVLRHLTRRDGCALALTCTAAAAAHAAVAAITAPAPRLLVVASGSSKLLDLPLRHDGQPYAAAGDQPFAAVPAKAPARRKRARIGAAARTQQWLTGAAACAARRCVLVADYAARGVVQLSAGSLRYERVLSSGSLLAAPEGVALHPDECISTAYVACVEVNHLAALRLSDGAISQLRALPDGLVPWGLAAWRWPGQARAVKPAAGTAAAGQAPWAAALFAAVDEAYASSHYYLPPSGPATGGVLMVPLLGGGVEMGEPEQYCAAAKIKRPSGLCFDAQGCLWVTSLDARLVRLAGPAAAVPGVLLQELRLPELLPSALATFQPFDVAAVSRHAGDDSAAETHLAVTLHRGAAAAGAVAVLLLRHGPHAARAAAAADVSVVCCLQHAALKQPNMLAVMR